MSIASLNVIEAAALEPELHIPLAHVAQRCDLTRAAESLDGPFKGLLRSLGHDGRLLYIIGRHDRKHSEGRERTQALVQVVKLARLTIAA